MPPESSYLASADVPVGTSAGTLLGTDRALGTSTGDLAGSRTATVGRMTIRRMDHVGIVVDDLDAATAFFLELGLTPVGSAPVGGGWVDRLVGLEGVRAQITMLETPDGHSRVELSAFRSPSSRTGDAQAPTNTLGLRHLAFALDDLQAVVGRLQARGYTLVGTVERYEDSYLLCYVRGPAGVIVELAQELDAPLP